MKCKCGKEVVGMFLKGTNIYSGLREMKEEEAACEYHLNKAKALGYRVKELAVVC